MDFVYDQSVRCFWNGSYFYPERHYYLFKHADGWSRELRNKNQLGRVLLFLGPGSNNVIAPWPHQPQNYAIALTFREWRVYLSCLLICEREQSIVLMPTRMRAARAWQIRSVILFGLNIFN